MKNVILTSVITIVGGVFIFVLGQIFLKFFIDPIHQLRSHFGRITDGLIYYADVYFNPGSNTEEREKNASGELRKLASELIAKTSAIPSYRFWSTFKIVPNLSDIREARKGLIGLSNGVFGAGGNSIYQIEGNTKCVENIKAALKLPPELLK